MPPLIFPVDDSGADCLFGAVIRGGHVGVVEKDEQLVTLSDQVSGESQGLVFKSRIVEQAIEFGFDPAVSNREPMLAQLHPPIAQRQRSLEHSTHRFEPQS